MNKRLTIGILAHVDAGKTTLSEALLYVSGSLRKAGRVDHGDSFLDTDAIERDRGITIFSKQARLSCGHTRITLLDTPGHVDFSAETERTLQVLDAAVLVISGTDGVQGHTRTLWRLLRHYEVPTFFFVNKMDLGGADRGLVLAELKSQLSGNCVDFTPAANPKPDTAFPLTEETMEEIAMCSDALLEQFSEEGTLTEEAVRGAIARREVFPVCFGSALRIEGVETLLQALDSYAPSWRDLPETDAGTFGARIFKINRDPQGSRLTFLKVTGGTLSVKDTVSYVTSDGETATEKVDQIRLYSGDRYELADRVMAGEICGVTGLSATLPGMGAGALSGRNHPVLEAVMTRALILPPDTSAALFYRKIKALEEEDPALHLVWDEKTQEIRAQIMGQVQIEVLTRLIRERFGVEVRFGKEQLLYKETLLAPVIGIGHFEPLRHYAEVQLLLEPAERGSGITAATALSEDELARGWQRLVLTHVLECEHPGVLIGAPVTDLKITLLAGRAHIKHTEGGDFRQATYRAIRQGLMSGKSALLEPCYHFVLELPRECLGRALADLSKMQADFGDPEMKGDRAKLEGRVPVSEIGEYVTEVHAYTKGSGSLSLTPDGYDLCRHADEVIAAAAYDPSSDLEHPTGSVFCAHGAGYVVPWENVPEYAHCEIPRQALLQVREVLERCSLLPSEEELASAYDAENDWGRVSSSGSQGNAHRAPSDRAAGGAPLPLEEDAELLAIYRREFGLDTDGARMDEERRSRAVWKKKAGSSKDEWRYPQIRQKYDKHGNPIYPKKDTRKDFLIVDGYNILFQWKELRELAKSSIDAARDTLLDILSNYQGYTAQRVVVVFDAYRTEHNPIRVSRWQNLEIVFTRSGETADAYIERLVHDEISNYKITVATSDGMEQLTVLGLGALRMSARMLEEEIERVKKI